MSASRNLGMREARGELIAFIDADDCWRSNKLTEQIAIFDEHPRVDACCGAVNYWRSWSGGTPIAPSFLLSPGYQRPR